MDQLFSFLLEIFFHMNNHIDKVVSVMFVENVSKLNVTSENISKKTLDCFGSKLELKVIVMASFSNNNLILS